MLSGLYTKVDRWPDSLCPILSIVRAHDYQEAPALASDREYGNGVAIFTRGGDTARDFAARVNVGMVGIGVPIPVPLAYYTFGGWKKSSFGGLNGLGPAASSPALGSSSQR